MLALRSRTPKPSSPNPLRCYRLLFFHSHDSGRKRVHTLSQETLRPFQPLTPPSVQGACFWRNMPMYYETQANNLRVSQRARYDMYLLAKRVRYKSIYFAATWMLWVQGSGCSAPRVSVSRGLVWSFHVPSPHNSRGLQYYVAES